MTKYTKLGVEADFFEKLRAGSLVKQKIVVDYFIAYNRVLAPKREKVGYADLFAGPGAYTSRSGKKDDSIPVLICQQVVRDDLFRRKVHLWFNEGDAANYLELNAAVNSVSGIETLRYKPKVGNKIVTPDWAAKLQRISVPTLVFLDPCGYKGLSLNLVASALQGYGNDCIFFFNYSRVNMKLDLEIMNASIDQFFEPHRAKTLREQIQNRTPDEREEIILETVKSAIKKAAAFSQTFRFRGDNGRISHHLVYASKDRSAANMMKNILSSASSEITGGVGSGEHNPRVGNRPASLFDGIYAVEDRLLTLFAGMEIDFGVLLEKEVGTRYTEKNYRDAILKLEAEGRVRLDPPAESRRYQAGGEKRTLPKNVRLIFGDEGTHGK
jgi:three-Cys-motif partner protein